MVITQDAAHQRRVYIVSALQLYRGNSAGSARVMNLARSLSSLGIKVYCCSFGTAGKGFPIDTVEPEPGIFVVPFGPKQAQGSRRRVTSLLKFFFAVRFAQQVGRLIRRQGGDPVVYFYPTTEISFDFATLLWLKFTLGLRVFYEVNELRRAAIPHTKFSSHEMIDVVKRALAYFRFGAVEVGAAGYDGLVVISTALERYFRRYNKTILRIPILADEPEEKSVPSLDFPIGGTFRIGFSGWIARSKEGFDILYEALAMVRKEYPKIELHLYGPIAEYDRKALLLELPILFHLDDCIIYHGTVPQQDLIKELRTLHLLILPRPWSPQTHFGFSTKLTEYLVSGVPSLVTDVSDNSLFIKNRVNGLLVPPGNARLMSAEILNLIKDYRFAAHGISLAGQQTAMRELHWRNFGKPLQEFLWAR